MRIKVIIPNAKMDRDTLNAREVMLARALAADTEISVDCVSEGPVSIESNSDEASVTMPLLDAIRLAEMDGFNAVVIYCFSDVALDAAREQVRIPVIGPGEISISIANLLANRFAVITTTRDNIARTRHRLHSYGDLTKKMVTIRALDIPVVDLRKDPDITRRCLHQVCQSAIAEDGIDTVVLGCLGMAHYGAELEAEYGITVLDPAFIAVASAESWARLGIRHNRRTYQYMGDDSTS